MKKTNKMKRIVAGVIGITGLICGVSTAAEPTEYYTEPAYFLSRPNPTADSHFGYVGVTGLKLRVKPGVILKVEETLPGSPADGKFAAGDVVTGVNGVAHQGRNPFVVFGNALTEAEAKDGKLVFDVIPAGTETTKQVEVSIPVLGLYSPTWPLDCKKSKLIIDSAAKYYSQMKHGGVEGGLSCLFLLSTGDDRYLPIVKDYFDNIGKNIQGIGGHTWNNGYNGIACGEYYLRTGDESVLPIMQYYCDDAKNRQVYGIGWSHWDNGISPEYVAGGLVNAAGVQMATTMLLGKECGVNVDEKTLLGALEYFYRFAGHGSVAYGDQRPEGWLGSANGKDGMVAAMMQLACSAEGDTLAYRKARNTLALGIVVADQVVVYGHGDDGRSDITWRGLTASYVRDFKPDEYHACMNRLRWLYDLSRRPSGALGVATCQSHDDDGSGAATVLAYTAPLKTLRITGAARSKFAKTYKLPPNIWGRATDLEFLSVDHAKAFNTYGPDEPEEKAYMRLWNTTYKQVPYPGDRQELLKNVHHRNVSIRTMAARLLMHAGEFKEIEKLLLDRDARIRRAGLDALTDYDFWIGMGGKPITSENVSPAMLESIRKILADPKESLFVLDGALIALSRAPAAEVAKSLPLILPLTNSNEWLIRDSAALALGAAAQDESVRKQAIDALGQMFLRENRVWARTTMASIMTKLSSAFKPDSEYGTQITSFIKSGTQKTPMLPGSRGDESSYFIKELVLTGLNTDPANALQFARLLKPRLAELKTNNIIATINPFLTAIDKTPAADREALVNLLYGEYRQELIKRIKDDNSKLDTILALTQIKDKTAGWTDVSTPLTAERVWKFTSFEAKGKDVLPAYEVKRFRNVTVPEGMEKWYLPEFDDSKWSSGKAPIGKAILNPSEHAFENKSTWGDGEFLLARATFEVDSLDYDFFRVSILSDQGYKVYLNGHEIINYIWFYNFREYRPMLLMGPGENKHLKKGTNVLAVIANSKYKDNKDGDPLIGQLDIRIEGLRKSDLFSDKSK